MELTAAELAEKKFRESFEDFYALTTTEKSTPRKKKSITWKYPIYDSLKNQLKSETPMK